MSNHLAIAMITATLTRTLSDALAAVRTGRVEDAAVTTLRPPALTTPDTAGRGINVFLYHVVPNGIYAAEALPARRPGGELVDRPRQGLDLHYLLTFTGDESTLEPQRLMGLAVGALAERPLLTRSVIAEAARQAVAANGDAWEKFADLATQLEPVRLAMLPMTIEEATRLWSSLFHTSSYRLSTAYRASVAIVEGLSTPEAGAPPVAELAVRVGPAGPP